MDQLRFGKDGAIGVIEALSLAAKSVGAIGKDKTNEIQKFKYRSIDAVLNGIHDALADNHIVVTVSSVLLVSNERSTKQGGVAYYKEKDFTFVFWYKDGSALCTTVTGAAADSGDKVDNKCISIALKYALTTIFMIPLATDDPDAKTPDPTKPSAKAAEKPDIISPANMAIAGQKFKAWYAEAYPQYTPDVVKKHGQDFVAGRFGGKTLNTLTRKEGEQLIQYIDAARVDTQNAKIAQETKETTAPNPAPVLVDDSDAIAGITVADIAADEPELVKQVVEDHGTDEELEQLNEILDTPIEQPALKPTTSGVMGDNFDKIPF